ncbi:MAG: hypothetical protein ACFCVA_05665 [Gammaproteobacteria bacterium]
MSRGHVAQAGCKATNDLDCPSVALVSPNVALALQACGHGTPHDFGNGYVLLGGTGLEPPDLLLAELHLNPDHRFYTIMMPKNW